MIDIAKYLNTPIKEVISQFPGIADILNEYNIGCVPCNAGSCLLKDIVEIHNLSLDDEERLMKRIAGVIYPGEKIEIPTPKRRSSVKSGEIKYSPPLQKLVEEHILIKKLLALMPEVIRNIDVKSEEGKELIVKTVDFIRYYADKFHHAKEEEILFKYFDESLDIIKTMLQDHESARSHAKAIAEALRKQDKHAVILHLDGYKELLAEHIKKEDEILYPWIDRNLSISQVGELFSRFNEADGRFTKDAARNCQNFINELERRFPKPDTLKKEAVK